MLKLWYGKVGVSILAFFVNFKVWADVDIPLAEKVAEKSTDMDVFEFGKFLVLGIAGLAFLALGLYALATTGYAGIMAFNDWRKGKEEFGEMATKVGIALVILVLVFILIAYAYSIINA